MIQKTIRLVRNSSRLIMMALIIAPMMFGAGCKGKKKAMEAQAAAEKAKMEQEAAVRKQREEEERKQREADEAERARREAEAKKSDPYRKLNQYFSSIATSASATAANSSIQEALTLFASDDTPVLIVISESGGQKDYDRPTTIKAYLNYLKDQKKNINRIENLQFDSAGKIKEVELVKQ